MSAIFCGSKLQIPFAHVAYVELVPTRTIDEVWLVTNTGKMFLVPHDESLSFMKQWHEFHNLKDTSDWEPLVKYRHTWSEEEVQQDRDNRRVA